MKIEIYNVHFWATQRQGNGKERRTLQTVHMPRFDAVTRKHITEEQRIEKGTQALTAEGFYDIEYGSTVADELIVTH
ncbi:MAG: hypothetical protein IJX94_01510 [Clostridia bacterium]|nr:hypothetical protein [Clostridia bacterium]